MLRLAWLPQHARHTATGLDSQLTFPMHKSKHLLALSPFKHGTVVVPTLHYVYATKPPTLLQLSCCLQTLCFSALGVLRTGTMIPLLVQSSTSIQQQPHLSGWLHPPSQPQNLAADEAYMAQG